MAGKPTADLKKVKAAAVGRKKVGRNRELQYLFWIGGTGGLIVAAVVMLVINPDRRPYQIPVNDNNFIAHVNRNAKTWAAGASAFFKGWSIGDVKLLEGIGVSTMGGTVPNCVAPDTPVPDSFDARRKWPQCFHAPIYNMGNCTASWAIATASALSDRFCISSPSEYSELILSPQQLLSCDGTNRGCNGGDIDTAPRRSAGAVEGWKYVKREGLVSETCFPYQADGTVSCQSRCSNEVPLKASSHCAVAGAAMIRREILLNGPVVALLTLVDDFLVYRGGLYQEMPTATQLSDQRRQRILHAVKIIGWGALEGKQYWLIENSWGEEWGDRGYAKVVAGVDTEKREGIVLETYVVAGTPASKKVGAADDSDSDLEAEIDLEGVE